MKQLLKKISYYFRSVHNHMCSNWYRLFIGRVGKGSVIYPHCRLDGDGLCNVSIGEKCLIDSYFCLGARSVLKQDDKKVIPEIRIGNHCNVGQFNHFTAVNKIIIGDNLLTGRFVLITDNTHGGLNISELDIHPSKRQVISKGEVVIGNNVWLGDKVSILPGVHIGDGCIIGANSVVTHDTPPYCMAAGIPAVVIRKATLSQNNN